MVGGPRMLGFVHQDPGKHAMVVEALDMCGCPCLHAGVDHGSDCTDDYCGHCGQQIVGTYPPDAVVSRDGK